SASLADEVSGRVRRIRQPDKYIRLPLVSAYQLDLTTPGISPLSARLRKQRRQTPNLRRNARGRPQSWQRLCWRDLNFGFLASLTRFAVVAIVFALYPWCEFDFGLTGRVIMLRPGTACQSPSA